jgi:hypothetical protein
MKILNLIILHLLFCLFLTKNIFKGDTFDEELFVKPLLDGKLYTFFKFKTTHILKKGNINLKIRKY